jgi:uncharacterized protein (DUF934 family)
MTTSHLKPLRLVSAEESAATANDAARVLTLANDEDPLTLADRLEGIERIDLNFPKFTDGRAYSQAFLLRKRLGFQGDLRANGDVLIDQLVHMARQGFSSAVLKAGVDASAAQRQFDRFSGFYQGDVSAKPHFVEAEA